MNRNKYSLIIPFLTPALLLYSVFVLYPYTQAMYIAFTKWRGLRKEPTFVGLKNFRKLIEDDDFWNALFFAFMISRKVRFSNFYRVTFFFPQVMSVVAIGILWSFVYHPTIGILNSFLKNIGIANPPAWLGDPQTALIAIIVVTVWQAVGFYMVLFMAGCTKYVRHNLHHDTRWT